ncbi:MAG: general secretion pathway protein L [Candidatus Endobugula sp.]|jgi:general secretion pathway protein L
MNVFLHGHEAYKKTYTRYKSSAFYAFFVWWGNALLSMLPEKYSQKFKTKNQCLIIRFHEEEIMLFYKDRNTQHYIESIAADKEVVSHYDWNHLRIKYKLKNSTTTLVLEPDQLLHYRLQLPKQTEKNLDSFFRYEIDRLTPFTADDVYYDYTLLPSNKNEGKISVDLFLIKQETVDNSVDYFASSELRLDSVDAAKSVLTDNANNRIETLSVNFLPMEKRGESPQRFLWINVAATILAICLVVFPQQYSLKSKQEQIKEKQLHLASQQPSISNIIALKEQLASIKESVNFVMKKKLNSPSPSKILDKITQILPDHSYVKDLTINKDSLIISGLSHSASNLIPLLDKATWFDEVSLREPITIDRESQKERYSIKMKTRLKLLNNSEELAPILSSNSHDSINENSSLSTNEEDVESLDNTVGDI